MATAGTLPNRGKSGFVRTPPNLAVQIGKSLLSFPESAPCHVYDPTCGEGDFFYACVHAEQVHYYGSEISANRADVARQRWPGASIVTSACEAVSVQGAFQLILTNAPYFFQNGKRAPYTITVEAGKKLQPGGVHADIFTARTDWDTWMINHWLTWYDRVQVWKFPDRVSEDDEGAFEDFTQILVVGIRRATPAQPSEADRKRLRAYQWHKPKKLCDTGWSGGSPPPSIPTAPLEEPYLVPAARGAAPTLIVRHADEAMLLHALDEAGAHLSPAWEQATWWPEGGSLGAPAMPYTGEAHVAAEVMIGGLDGEIVWGPGTGPDAQPHLFTAFIGKEWVPMPVDDELKERLLEDGCIRVEMKLLMDKPILGVLNLAKGISRYYQGEDVSSFLQPWIPTLASRVIAKRKPLYRLDPADWELRVLSQFGTDKRLPHATHAGLAVAQLHRVFAMGRSLDVKGRTAVQGEPGTGKTRMAEGTALRQAYRWRYRTSEFRGIVQPAWIRMLRRAWLKNPRLLQMLNLEPVFGRRVKGSPGAKGQAVLDQDTRAIVAYRDKTTGHLLAPEDAGPRALPVLVTTPLKVTTEYGKEILAAFPRAEVVRLESHRDIPRWLERCATSEAPVVFGVISHSLTRAFGRERNEAVREKRVRVRENVLDPPADLLPLLEPVYEKEGRKQKRIGYHFTGSGQMLTHVVTRSYFYCCTCGKRVDAVPGKLDQRDDTEPKKKSKNADASSDASEEKQESDTNNLSPVTSRTYFKKKLRWCVCDDLPNQERRERGLPLRRSPLWQETRTEGAVRKNPQAPFASWSAAFAQLTQTAWHTTTTCSTRERVEHLRRDDALLARVVELALSNNHSAALVCELVERIDGEVGRLRRALDEDRATLSTLLTGVALRSRPLLHSVLIPVGDDDAVQNHLIAVVRDVAPDLYELIRQKQQQEEREQHTLRELVMDVCQSESHVLEPVVANLLDTDPDVLALLLTYEPAWSETFTTQAQNPQRLVSLCTRIVQRHDDLCRKVVTLGLHEASLRTALLAATLDDNPLCASVLDEVQQTRQQILTRLQEATHTHQEVACALLERTLVPSGELAEVLVELALRDVASLRGFLGGLGDHESAVSTLVTRLTEAHTQLTERVLQAARKDSSQSIKTRLVEHTRTQVNWAAVFFRLAFEQAHYSSLSAKPSRKGGSSETAVGRGVRLTVADFGPLTVEAWDPDAAHGHQEVRDQDGFLVAYEYGHQGKRLVPLYSRWSRRVLGYADAKGHIVTKSTSFAFRQPPPDSFNPYQYLYDLYRDGVALSVVDESHNGRGRRTDIARAHHFAMLAATMRQLTSGTHFGGDIIGFYHYWFRYHPQFWIERGYGWEDGEKALADYGVIEEWLKEYEREGDARHGSGKSDIYVTTVPGAGLSANLIPGLLEDLTYLTVLDVGAHMPEKVEIPKAISLKDPQLVQRKKEMDDLVAAATHTVSEIREEQRIATQLSQTPEHRTLVGSIEQRLHEAEEQRLAVLKQRQGVEEWIAARDLNTAYKTLVENLEELAKEKKTGSAARLAQGVIPRLFGALPCDSPYTVYHTPRGDWGDEQEPELVLRTPVLEWNYLYPMERWFIDVTREELASGRRVMFYIEQVTRSMARRLKFVLQEFTPWSLPENVEAEDRQQEILDAVERGHRVVIVPYRKVNEGLNLQKGIDTIIWAELAMNLFYYIQASQRAWRLGKEELVKILTPYYIGSATHKKVRSIGGRDGAAAAFAGEPVKGGLAQHVGADQTTLSRLAAQIEQEEFTLSAFETDDDPRDDSAEIAANFTRRNKELAQALRQGRQWFGLVDTLPERLTALLASHHPDVWARLPEMTYLPETGDYQLATPLTVTVQPQEAGEVAHPTTVEDHTKVPVQAAPLEEETVLAAQVATGGQIITITFGDEEDIRRVRKQRNTRPRRTTPKLKNPLKVKDIAALEDDHPVPEEPAFTMASIWDEVANGF